MRQAFALCFAGNPKAKGTWGGRRSRPACVHVHGIQGEDDGCGLPFFILTHARPVSDWTSKWLEDSAEEAEAESLPIESSGLRGSHLAPRGSAQVEQAAFTRRVPR